MKVYLLTALFIMLGIASGAQITHNKLLGNFVAESDTAIYESFEFDNNGKVLISGFGEGDYFITKDTLIVIADKILFKFLVKQDAEGNDRLTGISDWILNNVWTLRSDSVIDLRKYENAAQNNALLLQEYYEKTRNLPSGIDLFSEKKEIQEYMQALESLCDRNLVRACKELFGMKVLTQMIDIDSTLADAANVMGENQELRQIADKVMKIDSAEGHFLLSLYYALTNQKEKSREALEKAAALGSFSAKQLQVNLAAEETIHEIYDSLPEDENAPDSDSIPYNPDTLSQ